MELLKKVSKDMPASLVVFLVALPLCMGIAIASGVPPALGLVTGIVGGIVTGLLAGAPLQVSGPAAGLTVLVFQIVDQHGLAVLGPVVFLAGVLQLVAGASKIGQWFRAVNPSVIYGMLSGIGVLIISSQIHIAFDSKPGGSPLENLTLIPSVLAKLFDFEGHPQTALAGLMGALALGVMIFWDKVKIRSLKILPGPLVAVVLATLASYVLQLNIAYVNLPGSFADALNIPGWSDWGALLNTSVLTSAIGLAVIASAETLLCASALKKMRSTAEVNYDKELAAQGVGNAVCGLFGALPMTGVIVRSTANIGANAQTRYSAVMHGVWLLAFVLLVPQLLAFIPMAALAAVLIFTGFKLINPAIVRNLAHYGRPAVTIYLITVLGIVFTDLLTGVLLGVGASFVRLLTLFSNLRVQTSKVSGVHYLDVKGAATFLTLPKLAAALESIPLEMPVAIRFDRLFYIDHACMDLLETQAKQRQDAGGHLDFDSSKLRTTFQRSEKGVISPPKEVKKDRALAHTG